MNTPDAALVVIFVEAVAFVILKTTENPIMPAETRFVYAVAGVGLGVCGALFMFVHQVSASIVERPFEWPIHLRLWCIRAAYKRMGATRRELEAPTLPPRRDASEERRWAALNTINDIIENGGNPSIDDLEILNEEFIEAPSASTLCRLRTLYVEECRLIMLLAERRIKNSK